MKVKIDLKEIEIKDLEGVVYQIEGIDKVIGNVLFKGDTIEISDIGRDLHAGKVVEVDQDLLKDISVTIAQNRKFVPWIHSQVLSYFSSKIEELKPEAVKE